ncbi:MAG: VOC family protein [Micromonosporaceae bacterium]|nr:VOC family protein [Micromonosporaceae bacterium]
MAIGFQVTFDAAEPRKLAEFWALALGYIEQPPPPGFDTWDAFADSIGLPEEKRDDLAAAIDPEGVGPRLFFQRVPEPKAAKNRVHLDVHVSAPEERTEERWRMVTEHVAVLADAGATVLREVNEPTGRCVVMRDPEGNEFCVQ